MRDKLIEAIREDMLYDFIIEQYRDMPLKSVYRLLLLLAVYFRTGFKDDLVWDIKNSYSDDFE